MTSVLARHWRLVFLVAGIILLILVLYLLRTAILPFALGLVLAYLLMPIISWMERHLPRPGKWLRFKRVISIVVIFIVLAGLAGYFSYYIATAVIDASVTLLENAPAIFSRSLYQIQEWFEGLRQQLPPDMRLEIDKALVEGGATLGKNIRDALLTSISSVQRTFGTIFGFAALPFFLFYILKDSEKLKNGIRSAFSPSTAEHARNILSIVEKVVGRYIRAQLMLGLIVAYFSFIGLLLLGIPFAPVLAILAGFGELIPTLGPWISGGIAVFVTLAIAPEQAIWVVFLFLGIQFAENFLLVPRIQSAYLRIHPAIMIVLLVLGTYIAGFWGLLLAGPLTATAVEIYKYVHLQAEKAKLTQ